MIKYLLAIAVLTLAGTGFSQAATHGSSRAGVGTHTEVRFTSSPAHRKASKPAKLYITRDSSGRVISVKRVF